MFGGSRMTYPGTILMLLLATVVQAQAAAKPTVRPRTCVDGGCHDTYRNEASVHKPVQQGVCRFCHRTVDAERHTFKVRAEGGRLCEQCHWDRNVDHTGHRALGEAECTACHDPHAADGAFLLRGATIADVCRRCHEEIVSGTRFRHSPVSTGECTACHDPHESDHGQLLKADEKQICFMCHEATRDELAKFEYVHAPIGETGCDACHDAHGTDHAMNLREAVPDLCYSCHPQVKNVFQHGGHPFHIVEQQGGCLKCHNPHASSVWSLLKSDPLTLCLSCHDREIVKADGETIANVKAEVEGKQSLHGPVAQKDCGACHLSHGSDHFRLLREEYPAEFYAPFDLRSYSLCFSCHAEKIVLTRETEDLTDFRNGNLNLHYVHVNKADRGRTCRACHATHGSDQPKHIRESVPFGMWEIPLRFTQTATGGTCQTGCHEEHAYDREAPVPYRPTVAPATENTPDRKHPASQPGTGVGKTPQQPGEGSHAEQ